MERNAVRGPSVLVVSDSHGTPYVGRSYAAMLADMLASRPIPASVRLVSFSGIPLAKWADQLPGILADPYDVVVLQYGNADVHPRVRLAFREAVRRVTGIKLRDTWFQVPPRFGPKFVAKFPFQVLKGVLVAAMGPETFTSVDRLVDLFREARCRLRRGTVFIAVPLFPVRPWLYGSSHNAMVAEFNRRLQAEFGTEVLNVPPLSAYMSDGFHWAEEFHLKLAQQLSERIPLSAADQAGAAAGGAT